MLTMRFNLSLFNKTKYSVIRTTVLKNSSLVRPIPYYFHINCKKNQFSTTSGSSNILHNSILTKGSLIGCNNSFKNGRNFYSSISESKPDGFFMNFYSSISESKPVEIFMNFFLKFHDISHFPWWLSIMASTLCLRVLFTFPFFTYQQRILARFINLQPILLAMKHQLTMETHEAVRKLKWSESHATKMFRRSLRRRSSELCTIKKCHPRGSTALLLIQIPLWVTVSVALRNLSSMMPLQDAAAKITYMELSEGGFGWISSLVEVDPLFILPIAMCVFNLLNIEIYRLVRISEETKMTRFITKFSRGVTIILVPIVATVPSCLVLYWTTSSAYGLIQNLILLHPPLRRALNIPKVLSESDKPYAHIYKKITSKFRKE